MPSGKILLVHTAQSRHDDVLGALGDFEVVEADGAGQAAELLLSGVDFQVLAADFSLLREQPLAGAGTERPDVMRVALATEGELAACLEAVRDNTMAGFVRLPVREEELLQAVHQALRNRRMQQEMQAAGGAASAGPGGGGALSPEEQERFRRDALMVAAHDLRSPLAVIVGYAAVLGESEQALSTQGTEIMGRIGVTGNRLLSMVDRILDAAALESGKMALEYSETQLSELVQEAVETLSGMVEEKKVSLSVEVEGDEATYLIDQNRVLQALQNILSNAVKFSPDGGAVSLACVGGPKEIAFSISDEGPGMTAEQQARVFEKFSRFSSDAKQGSGLGLAIAKAVVELHGGAITVESEPGKGSTFRFTIIPQQ